MHHIQYLLSLIIAFRQKKYNFTLCFQTKKIAQNIKMIILFDDDIIKLRKSVNANTLKRYKTYNPNQNSCNPFSMTEPQPNPPFSLLSTNQKTIPSSFAYPLEPRCRICLQPSGNNSSLALQMLPCACKGDLALVHPRCMKYWIKVWLQERGNNAQAYFSGQQSMHFNNDSTQAFSNTVSAVKIRPIKPKQLKENTFYPFPCQVCHMPIYFDLSFHRKLKKCSEITKKHLIFFTIPLIFTVVLLLVCIQWFLNSGGGFNLYATLFFALFWTPLLLITIVVGVYCFTSKEYWVSGIYSIAQIKDKDGREREKIKRQMKEKEEKQKKQAQNQEKRGNYNFVKRLFQLRKAKQEKEREKQNGGTATEMIKEQIGA